MKTAMFFGQCAINFLYFADLKQIKTFAVLQLFRTNQILASVLGFSFAFIWHSSVYIHIPVWEPSQSGILMNEISHLIGHSGIGARFTVLLLLAIQVALGNQIVNKYRLADTSTVFPGLFIIMLSCYSPYFLFLSTFHFVNTLTILILYILLGTYNQPKSADHIVNAGLLAGISFLFFPPTMYLILFIFIALSILRTYSIKERLMVICGFVIPPFLAGVYYYWQNNFDLFYKLQFTHIFNKPTFLVTPFEYLNLLLYFIFICLVLFLVFSYNKIAYRKIIQSRKRINIMYWILGITFVVLFILPKQGKDVYLLLSLPLGLLTSLGFISMQPKLAEIFHFVLILGLLVSHYVGLFL
ncbi:MAG: DUF6427 family protein [Saprospiraceae bacterium]|nr:DUF6427 family protein [Saprospiraceae bacterium]MDP5050076.1 DUF6427 family protein [Saprospiraceae bacterium]MDP5090951.1 DUF6427 family protein [Saprospiraceae bacterium]